MLTKSTTVMHVFSTCEPGGAQLRTCELLPCLGEDLEHVVITLDAGRTDPRDLPGGDAWRAWSSLPKTGSLRTTRLLRAELRRWRPGLVLTYDWGAIDGVIANALSSRVPLIHHEDGFGADEAVGFKRRRIWARRLAFKRVDRLVVPSHELVAVARERWRFPEGRLSLIPNGIDTQRFAPRRSSLLRQRLGIPESAALIGMAARLDRVKNVPRAISALSMLTLEPRPHLVIAGDGPERDHIRARAAAEAVGDRVHILGHVPDPAEVYAGVDLLLIASDREQLPRTLLEAMSCALPVVTTHVGDVARALPPEQGPFIVPLQGSETAGLLAQALGRLLSEPRLRGELGLVNRTRVKVGFDARTMRAAYRALYRGALTGRVSR